MKVIYAPCTTQKNRRGKGHLVSHHPNKIALVVLIFFLAGWTCQQVCAMHIHTQAALTEEVFFSYF